MCVANQGIAVEIDLSQFHQVFFEESLEGLDSMEEVLLDLEGEPDSESINTIFRAAHSIKGGSSTFHFQEIADFTHLLETLLDEIRDGKRQINKEIVDLLLKSVDEIRQMISHIQNDEPVGDSHKELESFFSELLASENTNGQQLESEQQQDLEEPESKFYEIEFLPEPYILETGNEPYRMFRELAELGEIEVTVNTDKLPEFESLTPESCFLSWKIILDTNVEIDEVEEVFEWVEDDCQLTIQQFAGDSLEPINSEEALTEQIAANKSEPTSQASDEPAKSESKVSTSEAAEEPSSKGSSSANKSVATVATEAASNSKQLQVDKSKKAKSKPAKTASASIRVGIDKVDGLIDLVGELVITQSMLGQLGDNFDMSKLNQLMTGLAELEQNTRELQESIMRIRMLPIGFVFNRMPRLVRDLSAKLEKKVRLETSGESTELDKTVMEQIGDPLTHLVRNALDHGIETTQRRAETDKEEEGVLRLNAFHQGGNIVIEVSDDGGGIDPKIIYDKAVERGLIQAGAEIPNEQILSLIMEPGFSTAAVISDVSGRGVGMDVVKRNINNLGGSVEIDSELGKGTKFTIRLPLTLAILDGQLIEVAGEIYVVPLVSIVESIPLSKVEISHIAGNMKVYKMEDNYIPIIDLSQEFEIKGHSDSNEEGLLAIVEGENRKIALVINQLLGQQQVVIKSLETHYKSIQGVSGATILGDGRVALILDVVGLARRASESASRSKSRVA